MNPNMYIFCIIFSLHNQDWANYDYFQMSLYMNDLVYEHIYSPWKKNF